MKLHSLSTADESLISALYQQLLVAWNKHNADDFAALFSEDGYIIGFDGSQMNGRVEVKLALGQIFVDHVTAAYVGKIRGIRFLSAEVAVLLAVVGMVPPGQSDLNPARNAIQNLVAVKYEDQWRIALFQNTPAQFDGRPDIAQALTDELRQLL